MTNHVHLLLTPSSAQSCGVLMRNLGQRYVQYFNRRYQRSGTLWEGRFKSCLVESASYVMACYRYRELCAADDDPAFLAAIRDATNGGFALIGEQLKSTLPADQQRRLERKPPGPPAKSIAALDQAHAQLEFELGLRPRTS